MSRHNPKEKTKANNQQKEGKNKTLCKWDQGYKMTINDNKEDLRWKSSHLPQIG
jgi:hypothetical protein